MYLRCVKHKSPPKAKSLKKLKKLKKLNVGCGGRALPGYVNVDNFHSEQELRKLNAHVPKRGTTYVKADALDLPFPDNSFDLVENTDMIEHLRMTQVVPALREWYRVLRSGGELIVTTIDFSDLARAWLEFVDGRPFDLKTYVDWAEVVYGIQVDDGQYHKTPFTPEFMKLCLELAGFEGAKISLAPRGGPPPAEYHERPESAGRVVRSTMLIAHARKP